MKKELKFQEERYYAFEKQLNGFADILVSALNELEKQGVTGYNCEKLKQGNFLEIFENYHKKQKLKNDVTKNMIYEKFLDLYGYNNIELQKLQNTYISYLNRDFEFYAVNNSFYNYCKTVYRQNPTLKHFVEKSPTINRYKVFDFVSVRGNNIKVSIPKELFTIYATNQNQLNIISDIMNFVALAKRLDLNYKSVYEPLKKYLIDNSNTFSSNNKLGLERDMETINFDYNKILTIK